MMMGYREYARHRGVSLGAVQKALRDNRITATEEKKIDATVADRDWQINTDASRIAVSVTETTSTPAQKEIFLSPPAGGEDDSQASDEVTGADKTAREYREHRGERERYTALKQKLEYEMLVGKVINVEDAQRIAYTTFRGVRDSVMNVAARIKDQLAAETDPYVCEQLLESELAAALGAVNVGNLLVEQEE